MIVATNLATEESMSTNKWNVRVGQPAWPTMMRSDKYPFLAALDFCGVDRTEIRNLAGDVDIVKADILQTRCKELHPPGVPAAPATAASTGESRLTG